MSGVYRGQPLARWCFEQGYRGKNDEGKFSHTLFSGGVWSIPDDKSDEFLERYAQDLNDGFYHYVNEYTTPFFNMYADIDIFTEGKNEADEFIVDFVTRMQNILCRVYNMKGHKSFNTILSVNSKKYDDSRRAWKTGLHMNWPELVVDKKMAMSICSCWIYCFEQEFGDKIYFNKNKSWQDLFDVAVYENGNLRMMGSRKAVSCSSCAPERKKAKRVRQNTYQVECSKCQSTGYLDKGRPYKPMLVVNSDGTTDDEKLERLQSDRLFLLKSTTLRSNAKEMYPRVARYRPNWLPQNRMLRSNKKVQARAKNKNGDLDEDASEELVKWNGRELMAETVAPDSIKFNMIEKVIRLVPNQSHANVESIRLMVPVKNLKKPFFMVQTDSRWCFNKNCEHNTATVFFVVSNSGIRQMCNSIKHDEHRRFGYCSKRAKGYDKVPGKKKPVFKSPVWSVDPRYKAFLFACGRGEDPSSEVMEALDAISHQKTTSVQNKMQFFDYILNEKIAERMIYWEQRKTKQQ